MTYADMLCREIHAAGWSYGLTAAIFTGIGLLYVADATKSDGHRYVARAETELGALTELKKMLDRVETNMEG